MQTHAGPSRPGSPLHVLDIELWGLADMQFTITINQVKALEWGLNAQQALMFAFVYECPSWATPVEQGGETFYSLSKAKVLEELPLLTDKPDTAYRLLKQLQAAGVLVLSSTPSITLFRLTPKGQEWNRKLDGSEKYTPPGKKSDLGKSSEPGKSSDLGKKSEQKEAAGSEKNPSKVGKKSEGGRKKIRRGSEKSPTNQETSNQGTKDQGTNQGSTGGPIQPPEPEFIPAGEQPAPRCEIPADMPGPKDTTCKTFRTWANYAIAYRNRHKTWPVWNATVGGMLGKLVDRLGQADAPKVAAFFVLRVNDAHVLRGCHSLKTLLANAEGYHTQWKTENPITHTQARQAERSDSNMSAAEQALEILRASRAGNA